MIFTHYQNKMLYSKDFFWYKFYGFVDVSEYTESIQSLVMQIRHCVNIILNNLICIMQFIIWWFSRLSDIALYTLICDLSVMLNVLLSCYLVSLNLFIYAQLWSNISQHIEIILESASWNRAVLLSWSWPMWDLNPPSWK